MADKELQTFSFVMGSVIFYKPKLSTRNSKKTNDPILRKRVSNARACRHAGLYSQVTKLMRVTKKSDTEATKDLLLKKFDIPKLNI